MKKYVLSALVVSLVSMSANAAMMVIIDDPADVEDTWIWEAAPSVSFGDDGLNPSFRVQGPPSPNNALALIKFAGVPLGVTIDSAKLFLRTNDDVGGAEDGATVDTVSVHRVIETWSEATTWNSFSGVAGTDYDATPDGTIAPTIDDMMVDVDVTSLVQEWSNGVVNQGVMLRGVTGDGVSYVSSGGATGLGPRLQITYTAVPEPTAFLMLGLVGLGFGGNRWWKSRKAKK